MSSRVTVADVTGPEARFVRKARSSFACDKVMTCVDSAGMKCNVLFGNSENCICTVTCG